MLKPKDCHNCKHDTRNGLCGAPKYHDMTLKERDAFWKASDTEEVCALWEAEEVKTDARSD